MFFPSVWDRGFARGELRRTLFFPSVRDSLGREGIGPTSPRSGLMYSLSRLRVWGPQPHLRARRLDDSTGSRALSVRRPLQWMLGSWGLWLLGGAMLSAGKRWLVHASQPHLPIHALFSVPNVLAYNTREAPCSSLGSQGGELKFSYFSLFSYFSSRAAGPRGRAKV